MLRLCLLLLVLLCFAASAGCGSRKPAAPQIGATRTLEPGVLEYEVALPRPGGSMETLWIYLPASPSQAKIPCLLIAPAGTRLFHGMDLGDSDRPEHMPYVQAGYAVVGYSLDGPLPDNPTDAQMTDATQAFKDADAGVANAKAALDYALANVPKIDPQRIYTAGHSSAGTVSLLVAESDPRIAACIAYAPCCNVPQRLGLKALNALDSAVPGESDFLAQYSPNARLSGLTCPVFLFHADDDSNVPKEDVEEFFRLAQVTNSHVTYAHVETGGHYDSMIHDGIPQAISWLGTLPAKP